MGPVAQTGESRIADAIAALTQTVSIFDLRHAGLALSTSLAATLNLLLLIVLLQRRLGRLDLGALLPSFARSLVASLAMVPVVRFIAARTDWAQHGHLLTHACVLGLAVAAGIFVYGAMAVLLGGDEIQSATRLVRQRLARGQAASEARP